MKPLQESANLYQRAIAEPGRFRYWLSQAVEVLEAAISNGSERASIYNNYAAILLELGRHAQAYHVLRGHPTQSRAYYLNMATVIECVNPSNTTEIAHWRDKAKGLRKKEFEIIARGVDELG